MIQFNLLPDVKVDYMRTQRTKRLVIVGSMIVAAISVLILVITFSFSATQKRHLANLSKDIDAIEKKLTSNTELTNILSVQNQLNTLPELYEGRPAANRLPSYIEQTTPADISIGKLSIDFSTNQMEISGLSSSLGSVNRYVDTLKYTKFKAGSESQELTSAFNNVVLSRFGKEKNEVSFSVNIAFDPLIFDETQQIALQVPNGITTRSQVGNNSNLFSASPDQGGDDEN